MTPEELLILLYEGLSININKAILNINKKKIAEAHANIKKAENIIIYLIEILDISFPIANDLLRLYEYIYLQLIQANTYKDVTILKKVLTHVTELKDTWQKAETNVRKKINDRG